MSRSFLFLLCGLAACTEYGINASGNEQGGESDTGAGTDSGGNDDGGGWDTGPDRDVCDDQAFAGESIPIIEACYIEEQTGTFTPVVEWRKTSWSVDSSSVNIMMTPIVASLTDDDGDGDIDEDDTPDILVITYGSYGTLRAVSGDGGAEILNITNQSLQGQGALAAGDIDGDGIVEIIAPTSTGVKAFEHDGTLKWTSANISSHIYGTSDAPAIADMDGDGSPEITMGRAILNADGSLRGAGSYGKGVSTNVGATSFSADIDGDGVQELIVGNAAYTPNGNALFYNGEQDGYPAVADMDGDGDAEIIVTGSGNLRVQDTDGTVLCRTSIPGASSGAGGPPTIADFDGDGQPEIGVAATSTYTVFERDCSRLWQESTQDASSGNTGSAVFDFEGDGVAEAVYADETRLWVFNGPDGAVKLESGEHSNGTWTEYPVIADVDGDGHAEIVVPNTSSHTGIYVFGDADDSWMEGRRIWNQHAYSITNVNDDGTIPASPSPNWATYNNFRSGDLTAATEGGGWPDLIVQIDDVCDAECDEGRLYVWARVGNQGYGDVDTDVPVEVILRTDAGFVSVDSANITATVPEGELLGHVQFEITGITGPVMDVIVTVDGGSSVDGTVLECDEENNEDQWGEALACE